jgi:hypothetical protein
MIQSLLRLPESATNKSVHVYMSGTVVSEILAVVVLTLLHGLAVLSLWILVLPI